MSNDKNGNKGENVDWLELYDRYAFAGRTYALNWAITHASDIEQARARILLQEHLTSMGREALGRGRLLEARDCFLFAREQVPGSISLKWSLRRLRAKIWRRRLIGFLLWSSMVWSGLHLLSALH